MTIVVNLKELLAESKATLASRFATPEDRRIARMDIEFSEHLLKKGVQEAVRGGKWRQ